jgi:microcystin degradation protein MlrC
MMSAPRIALLGFSIECNRWAPPAEKADFVRRTWLEGAAILDDARGAAPTALGEMPGFVQEMDAGGAWTPVPILLCCAEPAGPVREPVFAAMLQIWRSGLMAAGSLDGVYAMMHGAGLAEGEDDPDGAVLAMLRGIVGPDVPIVASFDLHANVSARMVDMVDVFVGYRTNPHLDMRARGQDCARHLCDLLGGRRTATTRIRLPIIPPTVTMLTAADAPLRPYGAMIDLGQARMHMAPYAGRILDVSVMGGFAYSDTAKNGLTVVVTADRDAAALGAALAREIAMSGWENRGQFRATLTPLADATTLALAASRDGALPARCFADVADNPGGGGRGNTMWILEAFHRVGLRGALVGVVNDPALAAEAHRRGIGATFEARFNRDETNPFSRPFAARATVRALADGPVTGRRGIFAGTRIDLGLAAALDLDGIVVVVITNRTQCADPIFFERFGLDIGEARVLVVKSRGHFRGGFDEFFRHDQIVEVDCPGLTSPMLERFPWERLPRPVLPIDADTNWSPDP